MTESKPVRTKLFPPVSKKPAPNDDDDFDDMALQMEHDMSNEGAQQSDPLLLLRGKNLLQFPVQNIVRKHDGEVLEVPSAEVLRDCIKKAKRDSKWETRVSDMIEAKHVVVGQGLGSLPLTVNTKKTTDPIRGLVWYVRIGVKDGSPKSIDKYIATKIPPGTYKKLVQKFKADPNLQPDPERVGSSRNGSWLVHSVGEHKSLLATHDNYLKLDPTQEEHSRPWKKYTTSVDEFSYMVDSRASCGAGKHASPLNVGAADSEEENASVGEDRDGNCSVAKLPEPSVANGGKLPLAIKKRKVPPDTGTPSTGDMPLETSKKIREATTEWLDSNTLALSEEVHRATRDLRASPPHDSAEEAPAEFARGACAVREMVRLGTVDLPSAPSIVYNSGTSSATHCVLLEEDANGLFLPTLQCPIPMLVRGNSRLKVTVSVELE